MAERIPSDAEFRFIQTAGTGTVHIAVKYPQHLRGEDTGPPVSGGAAFIDLLLQPTITRCGKRTFPQFEDSHHGTDRFTDNRLCAACYRTLHPDDQGRAFDHPQPAGEDEGDEEPARVA